MMDTTPVEPRKLVDRFEEGYVTFYRWLLFVFGALSVVALSALAASLLWSTSDTALEDSDLLFSSEWADLRREVLPLRVKMEDKRQPDASEPEKEEPPVDERILKIKNNLLTSFSGDELEEAQSYFSARLLNEYCYPSRVNGDSR